MRAVFIDAVELAPDIRVNSYRCQRQLVTRKLPGPTL